MDHYSRETETITSRSPHAFRHLGIKSFKPLVNLFDNIFTKRHYHNEEESKEYKYDVGGPNIVFPKNSLSR